MGVNIYDIIESLQYVQANCIVSEIVAINISDFKVTIVYKDEKNKLKEYSS